MVTSSYSVSSSIGTSFSAHCLLLVTLCVSLSVAQYGGSYPGYGMAGSYVMAGELTLPRRMELESMCPKAFVDIRYAECKDEARYDWTNTKNTLKAECCFVLDDAHCLRESMKRNCPIDTIDFFDEIMLKTENQWRYSTECHEYYKRSLCHFPIWAIVLISVVGAILLFACIGAIIFYKFCR